METRRKRTKRFKLEPDYLVDSEIESDSSDPNEIRKSRIRDSNKEHARRMTILQSWSEHWSEYTTREGEAYPKEQAKSIIKRSKKINCPIPSCRKPFTSIGGLKYHYARCNIERSFTCKVCNPVSQLSTRGDLLRHMVRNHYENLPELNEEQKGIASSFLSYDRTFDVNNRMNLKRNFRMDNESPFTCENTVKLYHQMITRVFSPEALDNRPFKNWASFARDWELVSYEIDRRRYYPPERESPRIRLIKDDDWTIIAAGRSSSTSKSLRRPSKFSSTFYTGGITTASAWLPKPIIDHTAKNTPDTIALAVDCVAMDKNLSYKESKDLLGCIQFWKAEIVHDGLIGPESKVNFDLRTSLQFMIGHNHGRISDMKWCPLGTSWEYPNSEDQNPQSTSSSVTRSGLLALACGDGQIRIISVPHTQYLLSAYYSNRNSDNIIDSCPLFRVKPVAILMPPGVGPSTDYQATACTAISWNFELSQRIIVAGYANGNVALFDLSNLSPILYTNVEHRHIYQPQKSWLAHCMPITSVAIQSRDLARTVVATGSRDRQLKIWNAMDLNSCLTTEKSPITKVFKDFRYRGFVIASESAFTSFNNRVSYKYPVCDGFNTATVTTHRSTVWGLAGSNLTSSIAVSDEAGEVMFTPQIVNKMSVKRGREIMMVGHSLYSLIPKPLNSTSDQKCATFSSENKLQNSSLNVTSEQVAVVLDKERSNGNGTENDTMEPSMIELRPLSIVETTNDGPYQITEPLDVAFGEENDPDEGPDVAFDGDFSLERTVANKPTKFLLPPEHRAVERYSDFKANYGLEFIEYSSNMAKITRFQMPESCTRASNLNNLYCDRACDYPFSSIRNVEWSPNAHNFSFLLSISHIGLCRLEKVQMIQHTFHIPIDNMTDKILKGTPVCDSSNEKS